MEKIKHLKKDEGKTLIKFELQDKQNKLVFDLKDKRKIDFKMLNSLKNQGKFNNRLKNNS